MNLPIPSLDVYRNRKSGDFILVHQTAYYSSGIWLGNIAWGKFERFSAQEFESVGLRKVHSSLLEFSTRALDKAAEFEKLGKTGKRDFARKHGLVGISLRENGDLWLDPHHYKVLGLSGFGLAEERKIVAPTCAPHEFFATLVECFKLAD
jgi:hypothetical protein